MSVTERLPETQHEKQAKPRLLLFFSPKIGRCRRVEGFIAQVLQRRKNHETFQLTRIDVTARPDLAERFLVDTVPALLVADDRRVRARLDEPKGCADIAALLAPWLR